jgi:hypothetical protein
MAATAGGTVLAGADWTVFGEHRRVSESESDVLTVRFVAGDRVQFRAFVPALRVDAPDAVAPLPFGQIPLDDEQRRRRQDAGSGSGNGSPLETFAKQEIVGDSSAASGIGDVRLGLAARLVGRPASLYLVDFELDVKLPTADEERGLGTGEWDGRVGFAAERRFWTVTSFAGVGWNRLGDPVWIDFRDPLDGYAGIESEPLGKGYRLSGWVEGSGEAVPGAGDRAALAVGIRSPGTRSWRLTVVAGLTDAAEDFGIRFGWTLGGGAPRAKSVDVLR